MVLKRLPHAFVLTSLLFSCSKKDSDKNKNPVTQSPESQICSSLAPGQETTLTYYKKARAAWNESCASLAQQVTTGCVDGKLQLEGGGALTCEETVLQKLSIKADSTTLKVDGAPLLLTLEGTDQEGQPFVIDSSQATWTSSSDKVVVSSDGHVTANEAVGPVVIKAVVKEFSAELQINAVSGVPAGSRKDCGDVKDGATKEFPRYKQAVANFLSSCEQYQAVARCEDGQFVFKPEDTVTECRVAKVTEFTVNPQALSLQGGESRPVSAAAADETGFRSVLKFSDVAWTVEAAAADQGKLTVADGSIALSADLTEDARVKASFRDQEQTITVSKVKVEPDKIGFEKDNYLLKNGDTLLLKVNGFAGETPVNVDPAKLVIESSDPQKVSVENNVAKVLSPGGSIVLTAKYADGAVSASTQLNVEDELRINTVMTKKDALIAEKPWIVAQSQLTLEGPALDKAPRVVSLSDVCTFSVYLTQSKWTVDVKLQANNGQSIPPSCEAEVSAASEAGQKVSQKLNVPVRYAAFDFKEFPLQDATKPGNVIATLSYKLSSNVKIMNASVGPHNLAQLTPATCKLSTQEKEGSIDVLVDLSAAPDTKFCAGFLTYVVATDGKKQSFREQVTVSPYRPFRSICEERDNAAAQQTVKAISLALSIRNDCQLVDSLLRKKNSDSLFRNAEFALSLASQDITNIEPLARLTGLRELVLTDNPGLSDLSPLVALKSLTRIDLEYTAVSDFSPLYNLDAMEYFFSDAEQINCKKSEVTNKPLQKLCTQE